jgi:RNA polymerase sigma factor (sigma-70 family)
VRSDDAYAYTRAVLVNHITDGWRRPVRERATDEFPDRASPVDVADEVTGRRWLIDALSALTLRERTVIVLRHFFDMPEAVVAGELNVSVGTVKSVNSRALAKLRVRAEPPEEPAATIRGAGR